MKKKNNINSNLFIPPGEFTKWNLQDTFIENEKFAPIIKMIDKKFEVFIKKLISLSPHKEILERRKEDILLLFYDMIYERIRTNPYLTNAINRLGDMMNIRITEPLKRLLKNTNTTDTNEPNYKELMRDAALRIFDLTIDTVFAIPNLVLISFGSSSKSLGKQLDESKKILQDKKDEYQGVNQELFVAHDLIKKIQKSKRRNNKAKQQQALARVELFEKAIPDFRELVTNLAEKSRMKNGKVNYSKMSRDLGVDHKTAKSWCLRYGVTLQFFQY